MSTRWSSRERWDAVDIEQARILWLHDVIVETCVTDCCRSTVSSGYLDVSVRTRFWFYKDIQRDIILYPQPSCGAAESNQHLFFECEHTAQFWRELLPSRDQFSHIDHVGRILHVQLCQLYGPHGKKNISKLYQRYGLHYKR